MKAHSRKDARAEREEARLEHMHRFLFKNPEVTEGDTRKYTEKLYNLDKTPSVLFPKEGPFSKRVLTFVAGEELDNVVKSTIKQTEKYVAGQPGKKIIQDK